MGCSMDAENRSRFELPPKQEKSSRRKNTSSPSFIAWRNIHKRQFPILNAIFAVPNGFWTENKAYAQAMVRQGLTSGVPDLICLAPSACGKFHALLIELKTEDEKNSVTSPEQQFFLEFFSGLGYRTEVCRSAYAASVLVNEHLDIRVPIYPR